MSIYLYTYVCKLQYVLVQSYICGTRIRFKVAPVLPRQFGVPVIHQMTWGETPPFTLTCRWLFCFWLNCWRCLWCHLMASGSLEIAYCFGKFFYTIKKKRRLQLQISFLSSSDFTGMPSSPTKSGEKHKYANQTLRKKKGEVVTRFFFLSKQLPGRCWVRPPLPVAPVADVSPWVVC